MKTLEQIKNICRRENNFGMNIEECKIFDKYTDMLYEAWETWSDDVTKEFWESDEKPDEPTDSFKKDFFNNFCFEEEFQYREAKSIKYDVIEGIDFTKEEYEEKTVGKGYATFVEFVDRIVEDTIENGGSIEDAVFIANNAYDKL